MLNALTAQLSKCYLCIKDITQYTYLLGHTVCLGVGLEGGVEGLRLPWDRQGIQVYRERDKLKDYQGLQTYLLLSTYVADLKLLLKENQIIKQAGFIIDQ